ncbi:MAG TPA: tetraacyldisaccharide 4'-kinase [Caulobacteraceae bacterium]|nr:tetraacyldisaccharide 4'-kinase [Caulobacteraceae bacterium]
MRTPRWWYEPDNPLARLAAVALSPLAAIWARATARRLRVGRPVAAGVPVICVGNATLGGSGKTPVAAALAARLASRGAHILCSGHRGRIRGPARVDPQAHGVRDVGDEALLLARNAAVWVGRDRAAAAARARAAGARALIMDDGHQNPSLEKTLAILVVDGDTRAGQWPFGTGAIFPAGPMREPLRSALQRADAVLAVLPKGEALDPRLQRLLAAKPLLTARLQPREPAPSGRRLAFAGIAKPWKFAEALEAAGCDLVGFAALGDHRIPSEAWLRKLERRAARLQAGLITTEKDWVRLPDSWRRRIRPWPVEIQFDDEAAVDALLSRALG